MISIWIRVFVCTYTTYTLYATLNRRERCYALLSSFFNLCLSFATILSFSVWLQHEYIHVALDVLEYVCVLFQNLIQILLPFFTFHIRKQFFCFILPKYLTPKNTIVVFIRCDCKRWYKTFRSVSGIHIHAHTQFSCLVYNLFLSRLHLKKDAMLSQRKMLPNDFFGLVYFLLNFVLFNSLNLMRERETRVAIT